MSVTAFDRFHTYMRAFRLGASTGQLTEWHEKALAHPDEQIRSAWNAGYAQGKDARADAVLKAKLLTGHVPSILRITDKDDT